MTKQFTGATRVWLTDPKWKSIDSLNAIIDSGRNDEAVNYVVTSNHDMTASGWFEIGTATVTVTLHETDAVTAKQVQALQAELEKFRADAHLHEQALLARISELQALTFNPA